MHSTEKVIADLKTSTQELLNVLNEVNEQDFYLQPGGKWSVAQHGEHLLKLESLIVKILPQAHATERAADLKIAPVKSGLEDMNRRFVAPDLILPPDECMKKAQLMAALETVRTKLANDLGSYAMDMTVDFKHPVIGSMTRLEWIYFLIHHAQRHSRQIREMGLS